MVESIKYYDFFNYIPSCVVVHDADSAILFSNQAARDFFGLTMEQMQGREATDPVWYFIHEDGTRLEVAEYPVQQVLASGKALKQFFLGVIRSDISHPLWAICRARPFLDKETNKQHVIVSFEDVTESVETKRKLAEATEQLKETYKLARIGVWRWIVETDTVSWSEELYGMTGLDSKLPPPTYAEMPKIYTPESWAKLQASVATALRDGASYAIELEFVLPDKSIKYTNTFGSVKRDRRGKIVELNGIVQDITERKISQKERDRTLELLEQIGRQGKIGGWELDLITSNLYWSDETYRIHELDSSVKVELEKAINYYHPKSQPIIAEAVRVAIETGQPWDLELQLITAKGSHIWVRAIGSCIKENGRAVKLIGAFQDITERKQLQSKLYETTALFQTAMDQSQLGVVIIDAQTGQIRYVNKTALSMSGRHSMDGVADNINTDNYSDSWRLFNLDGVTPLKDDEVPIGIALQTRQACSKEIILKNLKNEIRNVWVDATPVFDENGVIVAALAIFADITERSLLEKNLKTALESAKSSALAKSRFLDIAAHELRTPVSAFSLMLQLSQRKLAKGIAVDFPPLLDKMRLQVERISQLVIQLLDVSRLERGTLSLNLTFTKLDSLISQCIEEFELRESGHKFIFAKPEKPIEMMIDSIRVFQVITNLIDNATKYTSASSPIEISVLKLSGKVRVSVKDYGQGIDEKLQQDLFAPFSRGTNEFTEQAGGLGLGLYISQEIIALHKGTIGVTSKLGVGSTFYFELPL